MPLPDHARVWVYSAERPLSTTEGLASKVKATAFAEQWVAHSNQLHAAADLLEDRFLILAVDESMAGASGCSIDSSVRFVQQLGAELGVDFFNRMLFSYRDENDKVYTVDRPTFKTNYQTGKITPETIIFDPLVKTLGELKAGFEKPLGNSWMMRALRL